MKLVALVLMMMMVCSCLATPIRARMRQMHEKEEQKQLDNAVAVESIDEEKSKVSYPDGSIENHHSIPRQYFNQQGSGSNGDDGDNNDNGSGLREQNPFYAKSIFQLIIEKQHQSTSSPPKESTAYDASSDHQPLHRLSWRSSLEIGTCIFAKKLHIYIQL
ncbi:unnamed protein product [Ilex paraguariensis]|uniref:Uncharacterized protein n=1 Tax=Ilex paraguariensis TaxID=185542 RepID=A0ABC8UMX9_9AQUA